MTSLVVPLVTPEGTTTASSIPSVTSLLPLKRRLPKAPVFIARHVPPRTSFVSQSSSSSSSASSSSSSSTPPHRTYCFDDDYPSIAASESTAAPPPHPYYAPPPASTTNRPRRPSVTGAIRRRISLARRQEDHILPTTISQKFRRTVADQDSVLDDWNRSRNRSSTMSSSHRNPHPHHSQPFICAPFTFRSLFSKTPRFRHSVSKQHASSANAPPPLVSAHANAPPPIQEDINFVGALAYDDFMHGHNRPKKAVRVLARFRRT